MISNRFGGFDSEFDVVKSTLKVSLDEVGPYQRFVNSNFGSESELSGLQTIDLGEIAAIVNRSSMQSVSTFQSALPPSFNDGFFVDRTLVQAEAKFQADATGWVNSQTSSNENVVETPQSKAPSYIRQANSGSATGEATYLQLISDLLGGLSTDQIETIRSLQYDQNDNKSLYVSSTVSGSYVDGSDSFVAANEVDYHGSSCPCCDCGNPVGPQKVGNGGSGGGDTNDFAPVVSATDMTVESGRFFNVTELFTYLDYDGNPLQALRVIDKGQPDETGYWFYNGARVTANQWIEVPVANLDRLRFYGAEVEYNEAVGIMVSDGKFWSTADFARVITVLENNLRPTAQGFAGTVLSGESVKFQDYIRAEDPEDNLLKMRIIDRVNNPNSGRFSVNGVDMTQGQWFEVDIADLDTIDYYGAKNGQAEFVAFQVYDGRYWSNVANFKMTTTFNYFRPTVSTVEVDLDSNAVVQVGKWLTFADADGNTAKRFRFYDTGSRADGGYFTIDGVQQTANQWFEVLAKDMYKVQYHASGNADFEKFRVMAFDGRYWSSIATGSVTVRVSPTTDMPDTLVLSELESVDLKAVLQVSGNGISIKNVYVYEPISENNGTLAYNGTRLDTGVVHKYTWDQFNNLQYIAGSADAGRHLDNFLVKFDNGVAETQWERINVVTEVVGSRALVTGASWTTTPGTGTEITYSFPLTVPGYYADDADERTDIFVSLTANQRARVRAALDLYASMSGLTFREVPDAVGGMMRFAITDLPDGVLGWAYFPDPSKANNTLAGDVWLDDVLIGDPFADGTEGWLTVIHEIGHALGLGHPFTAPGETGPQLPTETSNHFYTEMSYTRTGQVPQFTSVTGPYDIAGGTTTYGIDTPMLYDLVEIQRLYGASTAQNPEDNVYRWSSTSPFRETLRDTAGIDTINASNFGTDQTIDLRSGHFSSIGLQDATVMLSHDTVIENALGGAGNDIINGNEENNLIYGNAGNDILEGAGGTDFLSGAVGNDIYVWRLGDGWDVIDENRGAGRDVIRIYGNDSVLNRPYGTINELENDFIFRKLGNDLRIDFTVDRGEAVGGLTIKNYGWGGSRVESLQFFGAAGNAITQTISLYSIYQQATDEAQRFALTTIDSPLGLVATPVA